MSRRALTRGELGAVNELRVATDLAERGYQVFRALSPSAACDLIYLDDEKPIRVEVRKALIRRDGTFSVPMKQTDSCDVYALVNGDRIEYLTPSALTANLRQIRGWRRA